MPETQSRKLVAILAADIAGYSALMGCDEPRTVRDLKGHQAVVLPMIGEFDGRIIDTAGDGILAEFASVVNAVECAVAIQKTMAERNASVEKPRQMQFRMGVNLGDVIYDDARIYGDGINIAARLEGIAEPGGIFVSRQALRSGRGQGPIQFPEIGSADSEEHRQTGRGLRRRWHRQIEYGVGLRIGQAETGDQVLPGARRGASRLCDLRQRTTAGQDRKLSEPPRI